MGVLFGWVLSSVLGLVLATKYPNGSLDPASLSTLEFRLNHPKPIGLWTTNTGERVDLRHTLSLNNPLLTNDIFSEITSQIDRERIPERVVHAKGTGAWGYFEVTHDVSQYTKADVFNGIGKKTPVLGRFSTILQNLGGNDLARETKALSIKFYTATGILDLLCLNFPVYMYKDPSLFTPFAHSFKRSPKTNMFEFNRFWDFFTQKPEAAHGVLWLLSDYGLPDGYRKMDVFPIHTYVINNEHGDTYLARFNFKSEQGLANLTIEQAAAINDIDYFNRDLYNAIEREEYPSWRLDLDIMTLDDVKKLDYDPFDVLRLWKNGTYHTVTVGRLVFNQNPTNFFREVETAAFRPNALVEGIVGPIDMLLRSRRFAYRDTQFHRLGKNNVREPVNAAWYRKTFNRDGKPPVADNGKDAPNYYPNSFHGAIPIVDEALPKGIQILQSNAIDLQPSADFYNTYVKDVRHRQRMIMNTLTFLNNTYPETQEKVERLFYLIDLDLGTRLRNGIQEALATGTLLSLPPKFEKLDEERKKKLDDHVVMPPNRYLEPDAEYMFKN